MKHKTWRAGVFFIFPLVICLLQGAQAERKEVPNTSGERIGPLIRKDLLTNEKKELAAPKRSIFSPKRDGFQGAGRGVFPEDLPGETKSGSAGGQKSGVFNLNLRYVGYVNSGEKIVVLVILDGEAHACEEGEWIREDVQVKEVSLEEIKVMGPDSQILTFALEGETS